MSNQRDYLKSKGQSLSHHPVLEISSDLNNGNDLKSENMTLQSFEICLYFLGNHYKIDLFSSPSSPVTPNRPLSADDWPLKPITLKPALNLDFSQGKTKSTAEKHKEADDAEILVHQLTPEHSKGM